MENLFDSEESYIKAIRIKPPPADRELQERLGLIYISRHAWKDAKIVFLKTCNEYNSANAWLHLGVSLLRLNELSESEDAFTQANILDNLNAKTWGYLSLLCLLNGQRSVQSLQALREAFKLDIEDVKLLEEIGDLNAREGANDVAIECYEKSLQKEEQNGDIWQKLGDLYSLKETRRDDAIYAYKKALELVEGDTNKSKIAMTLQGFLRVVGGHDDEIRELSVYLQ